MVSEQEWTNTDSKDSKIIALENRVSKLDKNKTPVLATVQGGEGNINQTHTNTKGRETNKSYVEGLKNLEYCKVNKLKDKITRYGQDWYWFPIKNMERKFDRMYMNYPAKNYDEWAEDKHGKREA